MSDSYVIDRTTLELAMRPLMADNRRLNSVTKALDDLESDFARALWKALRQPDVSVADVKKMITRVNRVLTGLKKDHEEAQ